MADIPLGDFITLIFEELGDSIEQTADRSNSLNMYVSDVDLEIPAHLRLHASLLPPDEASARLMVTLPSTRETPSAGRLGRIRITLEALPPQLSENS